MKNIIKTGFLILACMGTLLSTSAVYAATDDCCEAISQLDTQLAICGKAKNKWARLACVVSKRTRSLNNDVNLSCSDAYNERYFCEMRDSGDFSSRYNQTMNEIIRNF